MKMHLVTIFIQFKFSHLNIFNIAMFLLELQSFEILFSDKEAVDNFRIN